MNISAIGPNFQGRGFTEQDFINLDDESVRQLALVKTAMDGKTNKNRKVTNALFYSAPIAAGLGAALLKNDISSTIFSKKLTGVAGRAAKGLKVAGLWGAALGAIDLLSAGRKKLAENSKTVRDFDKKNPVLSALTTLAAGVGTIFLINKGATKLAARTAPEFLQKGTERVAKFLNTNKSIGKAKDGILKLSGKVPAALKEIGAVALSWAPTALLLGGLCNSINQVGRENREFIKNYSQLKDKQTDLAQAKLRELTTENEALHNEVCECEECEDSSAE